MSGANTWSQAQIITVCLMVIELIALLVWICGIVLFVPINAKEGRPVEMQIIGWLFLVIVLIINISILMSTHCGDKGLAEWSLGFLVIFFFMSLTTNGEWIRKDEKKIFISVIFLMFYLIVFGMVWYNNIECCLKGACSTS
jgi:CDP-diglyceride synthetase